jgi:hypothetical protein
VPAKDLKTWQQCKKVIKDKVLKKMVAFDPTSSNEPAAKFKAVREELQNLDYETCLKSGLAAASFFNFCRSTLELREKSVKVRKMANDARMSELSSSS